MNDNSNLSDYSSEEQQDRWFDLLIQRATTGLSDTEQQELDQLAFSFDNPKEYHRFEATAAAFDLSMSSMETETMPSHVHDRLLISAGTFFGDRSSKQSPMVSNLADVPSEDTKVELSNRRNSTASVRWHEVVAIAVAAACLFLMLSGFNPFAGTDDAPVASVLERMDRFVADKPTDLLELTWQPKLDENATGRVLWSDTKQEGYMVFSDLDVNDPTVEQYQLWIYDNDPDYDTPTDGGVFDISKSAIGEDGKIIIPIKATVPVERAVQFAVTIEKPGGVYVSKKERIPVLATIEGLQ